MAMVHGKGTVSLGIFVNGKDKKVLLLNALHVPELGYQLLSVPALDTQGFKTSFDSGRCWIEDGSSVLATATMVENLYQLSTAPFRCHCWYVLPKNEVKKLDARYQEGIMVRYSFQSKGYKIWDTDTKVFVTFEMLLLKSILTSLSMQQST